jgi:vancomycin resistance protein YoaR
MLIHLKMLHLINLFSALLTFLLLFSFVNDTTAQTAFNTSITGHATSPNQSVTTIANSTVISLEMPSSILTANSNAIFNDFFAKIGDEIIPIDYTIFSSQETSIQHISNPKYYPEIENINLCPDDNYTIFTICDRTMTLNTRLQIRKKTTFNIDKSKLGIYLESLSRSSKKDAINVILTADKDGIITVLEKEQFGHELNTEKILTDTLEYFNASPEKKVIHLPIKRIPPSITSVNYKKLGLKEKIGSGKSNFRGSPKNRIHNIHNATSKFEGIIIAPAETFSFVENLGDVDESTGYKEELVIKDNKTFPEFGGGICQVSTTLFRSAVNTGLEITERRNHAYPVQYYSPQGTDATIYIPKPDLQFKNNTSKYIMLQPRIEGTILTFDIFGTSDGRQVETEGPTLLKRGDDGSRKYVWWQIVNDKDGKQISKKGFWSYYQDAAKFHKNHETKLTSKPKNWSNKEWKKYKRENGM